VELLARKTSSQASMADRRGGVGGGARTAEIGAKILE
jgi:hypothetical protein